MSKYLQMGVFFGVALYFGIQLLMMAPTCMRLFAALLSGRVKWPGPPVHEPDENQNPNRQRLGVFAPANLFQVFGGNIVVVAAALLFSLFLLFESTSLFAEYIRVNWSCAMWLLSMVACASGVMGVQKANYHMKQVDLMLSDLASNVEPRNVDGQTTESEYAIDYPLPQIQSKNADLFRALRLFCEATTNFQNGNKQKSSILIQEALSIDPSLHEHAFLALEEATSNCDLNSAGPIYYWLGGHSEYQHKYALAAEWYERAASAFSQLGYTKRESRARCNLGNMKIRMMDGSGMKEFEKAIELNPKNGIAYINIGMCYYPNSYPGDPGYELALDAFANAVAADPVRYGPEVMSQISPIGYTWKEDMQKILRRVEQKRQQVEP